MRKCGTSNLTSKTMKIFIITLFFSISLFSGVKEDMERVRNEIQLEITKTRLRAIQADSDLKTLFDSILRTHEKLDRLVNRHPDILKNAKLKEPKLTQLKLKVMKEDEDMVDLKNILVKMHRKLEDGLKDNKDLQNLEKRLSSIESRLDRL